MLDLRVSVDRYLGACFALETSPHVSELAISLGMSRVTLTGRFRHEYGKPLGAYLKERQIEYAMRLLRNTDLTVAAIAKRSGFSSERSFYRTFRRCRGTTPAAYRALQNVSRHGLP